jgi:thiol-disulfide isomerase/thioredoxin
MRRSALFTALVPALLLVAAARGARADARAIIARVDRTVQAVKAVSYDAEVWFEGAFGNGPRVRATVKAQEAPAGPYPFLRLEGTVQLPDTDKTHSFNLVLNQKQVMKLDEQQKIAVLGDLPEGFAMIADPMQALLIAEFLRPQPFAEELAAVSSTYEGEQSIAGTACHVIRVGYQDGSEARWYFGKADSLPHRVDRISKTPAGEAIRVLQLSAIDIAPEFNNTTFATKVPEGFERKEFVRRPRSDPRLLPVGSVAPDWTLATPQGKSVTLSELRGKVVVLDFWATWCGPCIRAMPGVQKLHERFKDKPVAVFGINTWERSSRADPAAAMKRMGLTYGLLLKGENVAKAYRVTGIPTFYIIGPDGKVAHASAGLAPGGEEVFASLIESLLKSDD